jgi:hypothetical protein
MLVFCPCYKRRQCPREIPIAYVGICARFGCLGRGLQLLLFDGLHPIDEMSLSGTIALGRGPSLLTHHGLDRWKGAPAYYARRPYYGYYARY